jgi:hypothetical protein
MRFFGWFVLVGTILACAGCGGPTSTAPSIPKTSPVRGSVLVKGKPLEGVEVIFHPLFDTGSLKYTPLGTTASDGSYSLSCGPDGAPPGEYAVTFKYPVQTDPGDAGSMVDRWNGKYANPKQSKFKVTIKDSDNQLEPFRLD